MKYVNFEQLAKLVDDWREAKARLDAAKDDMDKVILPQKPIEFRGQKQFDEYAKLIEKYNQDFKDASDRVEIEQQTATNTHFFIIDLVGEIPITWFVVECKDGAEYGVYVKYIFDAATTVIVKPWDKKQTNKKG